MALMRMELLAIFDSIVRLQMTIDFRLLFFEKVCEKEDNRVGVQQDEVTASKITANYNGENLKITQSIKIK